MQHSLLESDRPQDRVRDGKQWHPESAGFILRVAHYRDALLLPAPERCISMFLFKAALNNLEALETVWKNG
jgi:hypothetical protein